MKQPNVRLDILTESEELFRLQIDTIIENAKEGFKNISDVEIHYINVESAYHSLEIRIEKVYRDIPLQFHPDYTRLAADLSLWRSLLQSQLMSESYKRIMELAEEAKRIASGDRLD